MLSFLGLLTSLWADRFYLLFAAEERVEDQEIIPAAFSIMRRHDSTNPGLNRRRSMCRLVQ
jgi:hypothetical protein